MFTVYSSEVLPRWPAPVIQHRLRLVALGIDKGDTSDCNLRLVAFVDTSDCNLCEKWCKQGKQCWSSGVGVDKHLMFYDVLVGRCWRCLVFRVVFFFDSYRVVRVIEKGLNINSTLFELDLEIAAATASNNET